MDAQAFQAEVLRLERLMYHVSYAMLRSNEDCADAVQEALTRAWQRRERLQDAEKFKAWLMRILVNQCNDILRKRRRISFAEIGESDLIAPPPGTPTPLEEAVDALKPEGRLVIVLHYREGYSVAEIARLLGLPAGTVKSRLRLARRRLGDMLRQDREEGLL